jgi:hypothetical protein
MNDAVSLVTTGYVLIALVLNIGQTNVYRAIGVQCVLGIITRFFMWSKIKRPQSLRHLRQELSCVLPRQYL